MKNIHALVLGATGATGQELVNLLLEDSNYKKVSIFVRRKVDIEHEKLNVHVIDFSKLNEFKDLVKGDVLFSALGTTKKDAGSKDNQYLVDYTYQYEFAKMASENGVKTYSLVSSLGANENSLLFYPKIKGKLEESVKLLTFNKIQIFQPPSLIRQPELMRLGEKVSVKLFNKLNSIGILKSLKPLSVSDLATKMINEMQLNQRNRTITYEPKDLFN
ncbi:NAD(P)H-binding protein [Flavobacteriales bacterium]|nr:NAD(P)H-binding protein [Flavobacteriales bacterium]